MNDHIERSLAIIRAKASGFVPRVGIVLGSGLGGLADAVETVAALSYAELPGFPALSVGGHAGRLILGRVAGTPVAALQGRAHYYEHGRADAMKVPVRTLARLGCECLILTSAAGSLRPDMAPGSVMLITDHINLAGASPLVGEAGDDRFVDMVDAYDPELRRRLRRAAGAADVPLHEGVYIWFAGPSFETPADIRAAARLGADAVGMSVVAETVLARHAGLKVAALSVITNFAAGIGTTTLDHRQTIDVAQRASDRVRQVIEGYLANGPGSAD